MSVDHPYWEADEQSSLVQGRIVPKELGQGSFSAQQTWVLQEERGWIRIQVLDDPSFQNEFLSTFLGKNVQIEGTWKLGALQCFRKGIMELGSPPKESSTTPNVASNESDTDNSSSEPVPIDSKPSSPKTTEKQAEDLSGQQNRIQPKPDGASSDESL